VGAGYPRPVLVFTKKDSKMVTRMDHDKFGNIPCTLKSYRPAWLKNKEVLRRDRNVFNNADGWHLIAVHILFEAVMAAAQQEDIELANESRDWLQSKAALPFFEECGLGHERVRDWIEAGCQIPYLELDESVKEQYDFNLNYVGIVHGSIENIPIDNRIKSEEIREILESAVESLRFFKLKDPD
jgi:hypothetical protein